MASGKILRQLIKAGSYGDILTFKQVSEAVIREERQKQHHLLANDLENRPLYSLSSRTTFRSRTVYPNRVPLG